MSSIPKLLKNLKILDAVLMTSNQESESIDIGEASGYAVHAIWTGTPTGTIKVQGSNDNSNFIDIDSQAAGGAAGQKLFNLANQMYRYTKVVYTFGSSTGSLTAHVSLKD